MNHSRAKGGGSEFGDTFVLCFEEVDAGDSVFTWKIAGGIRLLIVL